MHFKYYFISKQGKSICTKNLLNNTELSSVIQCYFVIVWKYFSNILFRRPKILALSTFYNNLEKKEKRCII